jgi:hypothetical protein
MPKKKTKEEFIRDAIAKHGLLYDYSKTIYKNTRTKVTIICKDHGEFLQSPHMHLQGQGCIVCSGKYKLTTKEFIEQATKIHKDKYDYSKVNYKRAHSKVVIICNAHGEFEQTPNAHKKNHGCPKCAIIINSNNQRKTTEEFIEDAINMHGNKYDYSKVNYIKSSVKVIIICSIHGEFEQCSNSHLQGIGCKQCGVISGHITSRITIEEYIEKAYEMWSKDHYDYSDVEYVNANTKVDIYCLKHDVEFQQIPGSHLRGQQGCSKCRLCPRCKFWSTNGKLCAATCCPIKSKKHREKTKEMTILKYLKDQLPDIDFIHNRSVGMNCIDESDNTNDKERKGHLFPDIRIDCGFYQLIVEVDEFEHRGANYACDKRRMFDIIAELGMPCIFIRYNPDTKESNQEELLEFVKQGLDVEFEQENEELYDNGKYPWDQTTGLYTDYMFYTKNN